ncbi:hypothetical protein ABZP36_024763 [Zizania latifolia]
MRRCSSSRVNRNCNRAAGLCAEMSEKQASSQASQPLCARGCGFFGSPATLDMCSVCYRQHCLLVDGGAPGYSSFSAAPPAYFAPSAGAEAKAAGSAAADASSQNPVAATPLAANRCAACKKKVGLTGFPCRCGSTYCGTHRYPEMHACGFDYRAAGRDAIARANPLVKGEKFSDKI